MPSCLPGEKPRGERTNPSLLQFSFLVWLLYLNMIIAALWAVVVVFPWFYLNDHTGTARSMYLEADTKAECPGIRCSAHGRGPETRTPMYYAAFGKENGDFEGFELNYLVAILLTIMLSFWFIIREVAARMTSASNYWETEYPARRQPFASPPFSFRQSVPFRLLCVVSLPGVPCSTPCCCLRRSIIRPTHLFHGGSGLVKLNRWHT